MKRQNKRKEKLKKVLPKIAKISKPFHLLHHMVHTYLTLRKQAKSRVGPSAKLPSGGWRESKLPPSAVVFLNSPGVKHYMALSRAIGLYQLKTTTSPLLSRPLCAKTPTYSASSYKVYSPLVLVSFLPSSSACTNIACCHATRCDRSVSTWS